ncbi:hypothetical protein B9Z55_013618 [Caenorhabditis nigoni]|nr:hypothetical protein B9Z55_013618 [Caenorhabditis nigoni]
MQKKKQQKKAKEKMLPQGNLEIWRIQSALLKHPPTSQPSSWMWKNRDNCSSGDRLVSVTRRIAPSGYGQVFGRR